VFVRTKVHLVLLMKYSCSLTRSQGFNQRHRLKLHPSIDDEFDFNDGVLQVFRALVGLLLLLLLLLL